MAGSRRCNEEYQYPYPSHVCAPNFVTVKLSGKDKYSVWKTQMLCLLESHDMLGFIDGTLVSPMDLPQSSVAGKGIPGDYKLWKRSDALVKGWILGSLSEQAIKNVLDRLTHLHDFNAQNLWEQLQITYRSTTASPYDMGRITREAKPIKEDAKPNTNAEVNENDKEENKKKKAEEKLYEATLNGNWDAVDNILRTKPVTVADKITINGNTAIHVAVGTTKKMEFVTRMLRLAPAKLQDVKNSDGSTPLHVAAIVGNIDAAKFLVQRNPDLLYVKDNEGRTPLAKALSNMHTDMYLYLLKSTTPDIEKGNVFEGRSGDELLVNAISSKDFESAVALMERYSALHSDLVLMAIAQNFPCVNSWERIIHSGANKSKDDTFRQFVTARHCTCMGEGLFYCCCCCCFCLCWDLITHSIRECAWGMIKGSGIYKPIKRRAEVHSKATFLLKRVCHLIKNSNDPSSYHNVYTNPIMEATKQNAYDVVQQIVSIFPNAIWSVNEDGHNIIQYAVINRSEQIYNLLYQMSEHRNIYKTIKDSCENNLLHLAGRLAPANKLNLISGAALQIQLELQWFKEVQGFVCPLNITEKNSLGETPRMVFSKEHKDLVIEGEKWMKDNAESYTITAALISTITFAAAITVPGGNNQDTGSPILTNVTAFTIFAISDAISLFTSVTSLIVFLSILTARFAEQDFLFKLPTKLIIGLATLFISTTTMIIAFGATLYLMFGQKMSWTLALIVALTSLPIMSFVTLQVRLIIDLISSTYGRSIFGKKRDDPFY